MIFLDGVYDVRRHGRPRFVPVPAPRAGEMAALPQRISERVGRRLRPTVPATLPNWTDSRAVAFAVTTGVGLVCSHRVANTCDRAFMLFIRENDVSDYH